jgi:hypothetical protein
MKLLSAQRVRSSDGVVGINAFRYRAEVLDEPHIDFDALDGRAVLEHESLALPPGGNQVLSYLDVMTRDDLDPSRMAAWIIEVCGSTELGPPPFEQKRSGDRLRFNVVLGLVPTWREELSDLAGRLLLLDE